MATETTSMSKLEPPPDRVATLIDPVAKDEAALVSFVEYGFTVLGVEVPEVLEFPEPATT